MNVQSPVGDGERRIGLVAGVIGLRRIRPAGSGPARRLSMEDGGSMVQAVALPDGEAIADLGQGTWRTGEDPGWRGAEVAAPRRGIEWDLLPWCRDRGMPAMAYSPIDQLT